MKFPVYSIRDVHTGFMQPTIEQNDAVASRNFSHAVMQSASLMNSHAKDYSLYCIGEFELETGEMIPCIPRIVCDASSVV